MAFDLKGRGKLTDIVMFQEAMVPCEPPLTGSTWDATTSTPEQSGASGDSEIREQVAALVGLP